MRTDDERTLMTTADSTRTPSSHRLRRLGVGTIAGVALAVAVPLAASAHVTVTPEAAAAGVTCMSPAASARALKTASIR